MTAIISSYKKGRLLLVQKKKTIYAGGNSKTEYSYACHDPEEGSLTFSDNPREATFLARHDSYDLIEKFFPSAKQTKDGSYWYRERARPFRYNTQQQSRPRRGDFSTIDKIIYNFSSEYHKEEK